ncbi:outer membrane protein assembly factor BamA [Croceimicrobium hydrocarbonivorans]|uniref:Outer membrane protein assembly factor BamA n=1 Tax=Croceimicrobium hydrocarbonivorans TaxID=2761580 RepID=A0A7H0VI67_9FLAO|nr:outer membrane protein assembly factor BamA [Croceimicrobium hydrocarbonivorans]QNR25415.1 outer membrane protein assembly factor BamA [Croceimicrobium hydrocarbonivorans]
MHKLLRLAALALLLQPWNLIGQITGDVTVVPGVKYEIGGIRITGSDNLDKQVITLISGLQVGQEITLPGDATTKAIENLWRQKLFDDIGIFVTEVKGKLVFLEIRLKELPKLSKYGIKGLSKTKRDNLRDELDLSSGLIVTENLIVNTRNIARDFFVKDGYLNTKVEVRKRADTTRSNSVILDIIVDRGERVKIRNINFIGNEKISDKKLRKAMDETVRSRIWNIFKSSKLIEDDYDTDKGLIIEKYNSEGFRDARIIKDSIYAVDDDRINIDIYVKEGPKYYFGDITWLGNSKYSDEVLSKVLAIQRGDVYDASFLNERLFVDPQGGDVSSLYLDNGYLFFNMVPVEVNVQNDTIDLEIRIQEGRQATINKVTVVGNDRTNDHVILRELRTKPGELFRRSDIQRSLRELQQLGFFDPQKLNVEPKPNAETGTVDIQYIVAEQSTSQLELQGGWGAGRIVGTLGLNFNNFSARNMFKKSAWQPLPAGDGQTINLRAQSNGLFFQSYSASFTEPWLGGKKPNSLTVSVYHNIQNLTGLPSDDPNYQGLSITGATVGLGRRLKWPDDYFTLYQAIDFQRYRLRDYPLGGIRFEDGRVNNINYKITLGRNSVDFPIYPRKGNLFNLSGEFTLPLSLFNGRDYSNLDASDRYEWLEYYKIKMNSSWFTEIFPKTVIKAAGEFGYLGTYNSEVGLPPFERFFVGGDGLQNFVLDGREIIGLRGYPNNRIVPTTVSQIGGALYNKFTLELRYLITENPSAQIFTLGFLEAGNNYDTFQNYEPFNLKRSAGFGVRIFMPMFGLLGVDFGYGFDPIPGATAPSGWNTHFIIGQQF